MEEFDHHRATYRSEIDNAVAFSGQSHDFFTRVKALELLDILKRLTRERAGGKAAASSAPLAVLDVGCGHGHIHPYLTKSDLDIKLSAVDVAATVVEEAKATNPGVDYRDYSGERLPYDDNSFDAAFTIAVMHHVPPAQWHDFLMEMRRVVRPGGLIAVFEHNPFNPVTRWIVNNCPIDENAVLLNNRKLRSLVKGADFTDIRSRYILFAPFDGSLFRTFDRALGAVPLGAQYFVTARVP